MSNTKKLSDRQRDWLIDLAAGVEPLRRFAGRSECGGAVGVHGALRRRGLIDGAGKLTALGAEAVSELTEVQNENRN